MRKKEEMRRRTKIFAGSVARFYVSLDGKREELRILGRQMLRSGASVGANYREASRARSDSEFIAKIELCAKEADETQSWLELLRDDCEVKSEALAAIWNEADELIRIFVTMAMNTKAKTGAETRV